MGDRAERPVNEKADNAVSALFYIMNNEMAKPGDEMNVDLIEKCAEAIPQIDKRYAVSKEKTSAFVEKMMAVYDEKHKTSDNQPGNSPKITRKKLSKRLKIILVSAVIAILLSGIAVSSHFDILSLFSYDLKEFFLWKDGQTEAIGSNEIFVSSRTKTYKTFEEFENDNKVDISYPTGLSENFSIESITYIDADEKKYVIGKYKYDHYLIDFKVYLNSDYMDKNDMQGEEIVSANGYKFIAAKSDNNQQATAYINGRWYVIVGNNKKAIITIIDHIK